MSERRRVSVIVPTWRREASLARCIRALARQRYAPDEVVVVTRAADEASRVAARAVALPSATRLLLPAVGAAGVIVALQAGLDAATGDVIAFTDDDAEPREDWIERLLGAIPADGPVVGAGGRDHQPGERGPGETAVGRVQWFGRVIGAHHVGAGGAREVDVLKGVNAAFRALPLREVGFDARLRGTGAQQHWELALCLPLRRAGWRLIYDPAIAVDHHVESREGTDQIHRGRFDADALADAVHNETVALLEHLRGTRRIAFGAWAWLVGTVAAPGLANALRLRAQGHRWAGAAWAATRRGRRLARATIASGPSRR
jgi:GT2 family glycosyltransferase